MRVAARRNAGSVELSLRGRLTCPDGAGGKAPSLPLVVQRIEAESLVLDLSRVDAIDAFGVGQVALARRLAHERGLPMSVAGAPMRVAELLESSGVLPTAPVEGRHRAA